MRRFLKAEGTFHNKKLYNLFPLAYITSINKSKNMGRIGHPAYIGILTNALQKKVVGLERGPLSLVNTTEELIDRKVAALV
jgi:hypothetical protein